MPSTPGFGGLDSKEFNYFTVSPTLVLQLNLYLDVGHRFFIRGASHFHIDTR